MNSPEKDADNLIVEYLDLFLSFDDAVKCAKVCVNKMLSNTGVDRAYAHWSKVKEILDKK